MFLHLSVILFTRGDLGVSALVHAGIPPPRDQRQTPLGPEADNPPPEGDTPQTRGRHPPKQTPPKADPLEADTPLRSACLGDTGNKRVLRILLKWILV